MARIIIEKNEFALLDFDSEAEFEKCVIENKDFLFGKHTVYIDVKRIIGKENHRGIPDAFLIDFTDLKKPQLYIVENEVASHDVYSHIAEQIVRFSTSTITSGNQIRDTLIKTIQQNPEVQSDIDKYLIQSIFKNLHELMLYLVEKNDIKIVIAINEITPDLNSAFNIFKSPPDIVLLQRYSVGDRIAYYYEPMRDEVEDIEMKSQVNENLVEYDTVVCAAFEDGFKHAYIENDAWWSIRLSQKAREQLKYLAIYQKNPLKQISHYAEIDRIELYKDTGKYILYLKNKKVISPIKLDKGGAADAPQAPRYTTLKHLLSAKKIADLWYWRKEEINNKLQNYKDF